MTGRAGEHQDFAEPVFLGRERRLHARAFAYWTSLLRDRAMPALEDVDPQALAPFAGHSLLIQTPGAPPGPSIAFVGRELRAEAGLSAERPPLGDIPAGSLLAELLRRFPDIVEHKAPLRFEAEFVGRGGRPTAYRGILLPFAGASRRIEAVYGIITWRLLADVAGAPDILAAIDSAQGRPAEMPRSPWNAEGACELPSQALDQRVAAARTWAALSTSGRHGVQATFHAALGAAYDIVLATRGSLAELGSAEAVEMVFGGLLPPREQVRCAAVLDHARRLGIGPALLGRMLDRQDGGYGAFVRAERRARRAARGDTPLARPPVSGEIALIPLGARALLDQARDAA